MYLFKSAFLYSLDKYLRMQLLGSKIILFVIFLRNLHIVFQSGFASLYSYQPFSNVCIYHHKLPLRTVFTESLKFWYVVFLFVRRYFLTNFVISFLTLRCLRLCCLISVYFKIFPVFLLDF